MSPRSEDLYEKALVSPNNFTFAELCTLVEKVGFESKRQKGTSHRIYKHPLIHDPVDGYGLINIQNVHGKAKPYQVRIVTGLIEKYSLLERRG